MKSEAAVLQLPCGLFDVWVGWWFGRGRRSALLTINTCWYESLSNLAMAEQVVVLRIASKAVIPSSEASKRSSGCYML